MLLDYLTERDDCKLILNDSGFLAYKFLEKELYISEFYLDKEKRYLPSSVKQILRKAIDVGLENGCDHFGAHIPKSLKNFEKVLQIRLRLGFKIITMDANKIGMMLYFKDCEKWK